MRTKKAQISIILIMVVILLLAFALIFYMSSSKTSVSIPMQQEASQAGESAKLQNYLQSCLKDISLRAVYRIGYNGGYIAPEGDERYKEQMIPDWKRYFYGSSSFPFVLNKGVVSLSSKKDIKQRISNFVLFELNECFKSSDFEKENFKVKKPSNPLASTNININDVVITADYPVKLSRNNIELTAQRIVVQIPVRLGFVYDIVSKLVDNIKNTQPYDISRNCNKYGDGLVNIYSILGETVKLHAIRVVDAKPLHQKFYAPFEFRIGIQNMDIRGECVG